MPLSPGAIEDRLEQWTVARLATLGADGRPHQVPIVFARSGGRLWSPIDGKPKGSEEPVRVRNLRAHPAVSLLLDEYHTDWMRLWWIRIDATAEICQPVPTDDPEIAAALAALEAKYPQYTSVPLLSAHRILIAFDVDRIVSWCANV